VCVRVFCVCECVWAGGCVWGGVGVGVGVGVGGCGCVGVWVCVCVCEPAKICPANNSVVVAKNYQAKRKYVVPLRPGGCTRKLLDSGVCRQLFC